MAKLDRLWNVEIMLGTLGIREKSFSDFMIYGPHYHDLARTMVITDADQLLDKGFSADDPIYVAATDAFGQTPSVDQIYIGRQQVDGLDISVDQVSNTTDYSLDFEWVDANNDVQTETVTITSGASATAANIASSLSTAIGSAQVGSILSSTSATGVLTLTVSTNGQKWTVSADPKMSIDRASYQVNESIADGLAAAESEAGFWYGLILSSRAVVDVKAAMDWVEANGKLFLTASNDADILRSSDTASIAYYAAQNNYLRTAVVYQSKADSQYPDAALMSDRFTFHPGAASWANVRLQSVFQDVLPEGDYIVAKSKNVTTFEATRNFAITYGGRVAGDEWIDVIRFRDYLVEQIKVNESNMLINMTNAYGKLPFTDSGIQSVVNVLRNTLDREVGIGISMKTQDADTGDTIPSYKVTYPRASEISDNDKANRVLKGVKFSARLAGAIHSGEITGSLVYSF